MPIRPKPSDGIERLRACWEMCYFGVSCFISHSRFRVWGLGRTPQDAFVGMELADLLVYIACEISFSAGKKVQKILLTSYLEGQGTQPRDV